MTHKEIQDLIKLIDKSKLAEFKLKNGDFEVSIRSQKYFEAKQKEQVTVVQQSAPSAPAQAPVSQPAAPAAQNYQPDIQPQEKPKADDGGDSKGLLEIKSPMVGTFYRSASPDKPPYVQVGDKVEESSVVCIVEAMKLFNEIESEVKGKIVKVLVDDASPVEYDQPLFLVDPKG